MNENSHRNPDNLASEALNNNGLWEYVQSMSPQTVTQLSRPGSREVLQLIQRAVVATLGNLPHEQFNTNITTSREELSQLLGAAMVDGYFLRNVEQRLELEKSFFPLDDETATHLYLTGETPVNEDLQEQNQGN
ncbi:conserved hypothetical protein [Trichormus variabilis ATCC 29413]|uniref:DUF760 domain-containing protein n=2 Tax=Anabaena variabilis TaxID=264691 RepID=Q3MAE7_TRIV2|nr:MULTISPECIES: DUF760 domain-containing protein [Nostocaceae]ABA22039.1 conserved hypothetical protein [Trichormus variabilis ATCC 29413]MBC1213699.1 DUF760 domain-containing protein [Trichormus variabilis ARAD]MBC1257208.1 DUF760 domain-containing protein [Trichormus variabilis V5]MBC1266932.1 DUF760 domain-containing protein [Trichormus variabilis FSR]MBC1303256.1 DUF760 domain-containing protein [Trichormus variabilis N2B]